MISLRFSACPLKYHFAGDRIDRVSAYSALSNSRAISIPQPVKSVPQSGQPERVFIDEITDPVAVDGVLEVFGQAAVQLDSTSFYLRRVTVPLFDGMLVHHDARNRVRSHTQANERYASLVVTGTGSGGSFDGFDLRPDRVLYVPAGGAGEFVVGPDHRGISLMITPDSLLRHLRIRDREHVLSYLETQRIWHAPEDVVQRFYVLGESIAGVAARNPSRFDDNEHARIGAYNDLLESLMLMIDFIKEGGPKQEERTRHAYSDIVKLCEAIALGKGPERLYVTELCEQASVSERTLQYAFQSVLGMAPIVYLARLRLHQARKDLIKESYASTTVSEVALKWGFWHFGEFAKVYRSLFGETPSTTLRANERSSVKPSQTA